jgi:hypothetical protein
MNPRHREHGEMGSKKLFCVILEFRHKSPGGIMVFNGEVNVMVTIFSIFYQYSEIFLLTF